MRLAEIGRNFPVPVFISIDGGITEEIHGAIADSVEKFRIENPSREISVNFNPRNLGLASHITSTVSRVLQEFEFCIVLEDDVSISNNFISTLMNFRRFLNENVLTVGGFSGHPLGLRIFMRNQMRTTNYFSAWGWMISRKGWKQYEFRLPQSNYMERLNSSRSWQNYSKSQKRIWLRRFSKVAVAKPGTWDFQMQFTTISRDAVHLLPLFRICDNIGFQDPRSTNNKNKRPRWMGSPTGKQKDLIYSFKIGNKLDGFLDSLTFAGDIPILRIIHDFLARKN